MSSDHEKEVERLKKRIQKEAKDLEEQRAKAEERKELLTLQSEAYKLWSKRGRSGMWSLFYFCFMVFSFVFPDYQKPINNSPITIGLCVIATVLFFICVWSDSPDENPIEEKWLLPFPIIDALYGARNLSLLCRLVALGYMVYLFTE